MYVSQVSKGLKRRGDQILKLLTLFVPNSSPICAVRDTREDILTLATAASVSVNRVVAVKGTR